MARRPERREAYRGFRMHVWQQRGGTWFGLAKGLGTVVMPSLSPDADAALADIRRRIDLGYERNRGVFEGKA